MHQKPQIEGVHFVAITRGLHRAIGVALATGTMTAVSIILPAPATGVQAVSCYGDYCSGQDPASTGCANHAITVATVQDDVASLQLRWSPTCKTNWSRFVIYDTGSHLSGRGSLYVEQEGGYETGTFIVPNKGGKTEWSKMIYSPDKKCQAVFYDDAQVWNDTRTDWV